MDKEKYVVVVGIDYSAASDRALDETFALACSKRNAQLHVANVRPAMGPPVPMPSEPMALPPWEDWAAELRAYVAHKSAAFQATAGVAPFKHLYTQQRMGDAAHELLQLAAGVDADLLVLGAHDWHGASRSKLDSVAEAIIRLAPCPVLVVRRKALPPAVPAIEPASATTHPAGSNEVYSR